MKLDVEAIVQILTLIAGLIAYLRATWQKNRWEAIKGAIPYAHRLAQKASQLTKTPRDDLFIEKVEDILEPLGIKLSAMEIPAVKALGSGEHQSYKLLRDGEEPRPRAVREAEDAAEAALEAVAHGLGDAIGDLDTDGGAEGNGSGTEPGTSSPASGPRE